MLKRRLLPVLMILLATIICSAGFSSCGTTHTYWGVEHEYHSDDYGRPYYKNKKKYKKYKKHHKHYRHHKHHHDDDD
jgi:lipoprotein